MQYFRKRHWLWLAAAGLLLVEDRAYSGEASVLSNEHFKPLAGYPGTWKWQWKNEHGERMQAQSTVTADPSGAFLIDRTSDIEDGKLVPTELNIYYWRSDARALGGIGFTSSGDHGASTVFIRESHWTEQSAGYDADGVLRMHVDKWEWSTPDTGLYQETHVVRGGRIEPDDFELHCQRATPETILASQPAEPGKLSEHLQPLARLLGAWDVEWTNEKGEIQKGRARIQSEAGGAVILANLAQVEDGKVVYAQLTLYYWQAELKTLGVAVLDSTGSSLFGPLYVRVDKWVSQLSGFDGQGKACSRVDQNEWADAGALRYRALYQFSAGQANPEPPLLRYKRSPR